MRIQDLDEAVGRIVKGVNTTVDVGGRTYKVTGDTSNEENSVTEVNIDNKKGRGAVPNNQEVDYFGKRVMMKPSTFIKLASKLGKDPEPEMIDYIKKGGAIGAPFLVINVPRDDDEDDAKLMVSGHEGRNRMLAIMKAEGDAPVETHLFFRGKYNRARHLEPEFLAAIRSELISQDNQLIKGPLWEGVGRIVKGVNTTVDVGPNEIKTQAAKFGNTVDKDGRPPTMSKAVKGKSTNVLYNIGLSEGYKLQLERDRKMLVLNITNTKTGHRTEVRGKLGYESGNYDPDDDLHQLLDTIGKSANISELINGEVVTINPKHPDAEKAKAATDKAYSEARYTAAEWAIIEGGHSLEDLKPAVKKPGRMFEALNDMATVSETIRKIGDNKWRLYSKDGSKNLGTFNSLEAAKKHEREVQYFKHNEDPTYNTENFADGKKPGRKGLAKRSGVNTKASVSSLRKTAKNSSGEKQRMAHWLANMKAGRAKAKK
jgi:hypothetical protein